MSFNVTFLPHTLDIAKRVEQESGEKLDREQLAFYQFTRRDYEEKGELEKFYQEYPSTVEEAFQTGVKSAFSLELRSWMRDRVKKPIFVGEVNLVTGKLRKGDVEEFLSSEDPLKWNNKLILWELPRKGKLYIVGVDASHGLEQDNAAIEVVRVGDKKEKDEQVAEWCGDLAPGDLAVVAAVVGRIYRDKDADLDALMAVECNPGSPGTTTQLAMEMLKTAAGIDVVHVPFNGKGPANTATMGGQVQVLFGSMPAVLPQAKAGRVRPLAVSGVRHLVALVGRTTADVRDVMIHGESGLAACAERRGITLVHVESRRSVTLPELGTEMTTYSAEEPDQLRGPQEHTGWADSPQRGPTRSTRGVIRPDRT